MNMADITRLRDVLTELKMVLKNKFPNAEIWVSESGPQITLTITLQKGQLNK